jgi:hypothetical protein
MMSAIVVMIHESKANKIRPAIVKYLYSQNAYWKETLLKYKCGDKDIRLVFANEDALLKNINDREKELAFDNKYQLLKLKYRKDKRILASIASDYCKFWTCLEYFRQTQGLNETDPSFAIQMGTTKNQISQRFEELLS